MRGTVYLVASGQDGLLPKVAARACDELHKERPRVAVTYAPASGDPDLLRFMRERMEALFPKAVLETIDEDAGAILRADLVFVCGGDPSLGARIMDESGVAAQLRAAHARGTPMMGVSAGAILLGSYWAQWPENVDESGETQLDATSLVSCVGVVGDHVFDTHNEEDDWDELRIVRELLARRGIAGTFVGIPTGGALIFHGGGPVEGPSEPNEPEVLGVAPFRLP
jgi:hypothetical protein